MLQRTAVHKCLAKFKFISGIANWDWPDYYLYTQHNLSNKNLVSSSNIAVILLELDDEKLSDTSVLPEAFPIIEPVDIGFITQMISAGDSNRVSVCGYPMKVQAPGESEVPNKHHLYNIEGKAIEMIDRNNDHYSFDYKLNTFRGMAGAPIFVKDNSNDLKMVGVHYGNKG